MKTDVVEIYQAPVNGSPSSAIIVYSDVWGWNSGRIRAIADYLGELGYLALVGKFLTPTLNGGTDGDAMSPDDTFNLDWIKQFPWDTQKPKVDSIISYAKQSGASRIGVFGFCYGGHLACWSSRENSEIACGVVFHPSMQLEGFAFGGDNLELLKEVQAPFMLCPAGGDLPLWSEDGELGSALKSSKRGSECVWSIYPEMSHGWSIRGDVSDPLVARDVDLVLKDATQYFSKYL